MRYRLPVAMLSALALLVAVVVCAQHVKKGSVAVIRSDELEVDWGTGVTEMTGNVRVDIKGDYTATMTASSVILKADLEKSQVLSLEARGPVTFVVDAQDKDGKPVRITAGCSQHATFSEQTMVATMVGNAHGEMTGAAAAAKQLESFKYQGESLTVDLRNVKLRVKSATAEVHMAPEAAQPPSEQGNP